MAPPSDPACGRRRGLVTGGTKGPGLAIAHRPREDRYAVVVTYAHDRDAAEAARAAAAARALPLATVRSDAASGEAMTALFADDQARGFDVVVHAAGFTRD